MDEESQEFLEECLKQAEIRWHKLLEESTRRAEKQHRVPEQKRTTVEEKWRELTTELREAEEHWKKLVKETENPSTLVKPAILQLGPRPRIIRRRNIKEEDIKFEIFPLPKPRRERGGFVRNRKNELTVLNNDLKYEKEDEKIQAIKRRIARIKKEINTYRKQAKKNKKQKATPSSGINTKMCQNIN